MKHVWIAVSTGLLAAGCDPGAPGSDPWNDTDGGVDWQPEPGAESGTSDPLEPPDVSGEPLTCWAQTRDVTAPRGADVLLVLDKSGSMVTNRWDHDADPNTPRVTRWSSLHSVVENLVFDMHPEVGVGAVLFPAIDVASSDYGEAACRVASAPDASVVEGGGTAVLQAIPAADDVALYGGTPAREAILVAAEHLAGRPADRAKAIVLVTDGAANCSAGSRGGDAFTVYDEALDDVVAQVYETDGIPVYVIGIDIVDRWLETPAANPLERLSEVALAGGVPVDGEVPFYNSTTRDELQDALDTVAGQIGCTVRVEADFDSSRLRVEIDDAIVPEVSTCDASQPGWRLSSADEGSVAVELCPSSCEVLESAEQVRVGETCPPEP